MNDAIEKIEAIEILDSRGTPTLRVFVTTKDKVTASASAPSGASTGEHEALELRDDDHKRYFGKGVEKAIHNVEHKIFPRIKNLSVSQQKEIDKAMIKLDGTENKENLGANAILGVSLACARCAAKSQKIPLFQYLGKDSHFLPMPMMNILNGGAHADNLLDIQEFMIRPISAARFSDALRMGSEIFHALKKILKSKKLSTAVGDEGGFAPPLDSTETALELIMEAIVKAGYHPKEEVTIALDLAASEFYDEGKYIEKKRKEAGEKFATRDVSQMIEYLSSLCEKYPIDSLEDPLDQNDWEGWKALTEAMGDKIQIVGDDLFVTNKNYLQKGIHQKVANSILIKLNQIGTLTETLETIGIAHSNGYSTIISHRSGETEDSFIADLAVAAHAGQIKTGSLSRSERVAKYNRLIEIEHYLGEKAKFR